MNIRLPNGKIIGPIGSAISLSGGEESAAFLAENNVMNLNESCRTEPVIVVSALQ